MARKNWSILDELYVLRLFKGKVTPEAIADVAKKIDKSENSVRMKLANLSYLYYGYGLENVSQQCREVVTLFSDPEDCNIEMIIETFEEENNEQ